MGMWSRASSRRLSISIRSWSRSPAARRSPWRLWAISRAASSGTAWGGPVSIMRSSTPWVWSKVPVSARRGDAQGVSDQRAGLPRDGDATQHGQVEDQPGDAVGVSQGVADGDWRAGGDAAQDHPFQAERGAERSSQAV